MSSKNDRFYFNDKGEMIDPPVDVQQEGCDNFIGLCATAVVPDGYTFLFNPFRDFRACTDVSELNCVLSREETEATIPNLCGGELTCPVTIDAVRLVGCVRVLANLGDLRPKQSGPSTPFPCQLCFAETACVNQVIGYTCAEDACAEDCFVIPFGELFVPTVTTDGCGRQIVSTVIRLFVQFAGC
ncbi:MAG TPA: hypothetical protein DCR24_13410 [Bacillus bacterium]|nr:hypothetical protein [Bacillus sp. (in: firmicutes)]